MSPLLFFPSELLALAGLDWGDLIFAACALAFVLRDEMRSKYADMQTRELHERVAKMELRWETAAELEHFRVLNTRMDAIEKQLADEAEDVSELVEALTPKPKPRARKR